MKNSTSRKLQKVAQGSLIDSVLYLMGNWIAGPMTGNARLFTQHVTLVLCIVVAIATILWAFHRVESREDSQTVKVDETEVTRSEETRSIVTQRVTVRRSGMGEEKNPLPWSTSRWTSGDSDLTELSEEVAGPVANLPVDAAAAPTIPSKASRRMSANPEVGVSEGIDKAVTQEPPKIGRGKKPPKGRAVAIKERQSPPVVTKSSVKGLTSTVGRTRSSPVDKKS